MPLRKSHAANLITFAAMLLASAPILATPADGWFGLSLNVEVESALPDGLVQFATIREVLPSSPASDQHLTPGDKIIEIEGQRVTGAELQALQSLIRKAIGEPLHLRLQRPTGDSYSAVLIAARGPER
jgi:C-terminal processing protease CtpA/Prc